MADSYMLTTVDNPFDPRTQWDEWFAFDTKQGYNTCAYLARIARTSDELTDEENNQTIQSAIDEICKINILGIYRKVEIKD